MQGELRLDAAVLLEHIISSYRTTSVCDTVLHHREINQEPVMPLRHRRLTIVTGAQKIFICECLIRYIHVHYLSNLYIV